MNFKGLKILVTLCTVFFFAATAFAGGEAEIKTDVPAIPQSVCDQAGWISMEVGDGFTLYENDSIEWSLTNGVELCKAVDMFLIIADQTPMTYAQGSTVAISTTNAANQVTVTSAASGDEAELVGGGGDGALGLHIVGNVGQQTVTVTLRRIDLVTGLIGDFDAIDPDTHDLEIAFGVGLGDVTDTMTIRLFDNKADAYAGAGDIGFRKDDPATTTVEDYLIDIDPEDNSLCIDTLTNDPQFESGQYVNATPDSQPASGGTQISFTGDSRVANITGSEGYTIDRLSKDACPDIAIGGTPNQFGVITGAPGSFDPGDFDNTAKLATAGSRWSAGSPLCQTAGTGVIITKSSNWSLSDQYEIEISMAVMAAGATSYTAADADEVWFSNGANVYTTDSSDSNIQHDNTAIAAIAPVETATVDATTTNTTAYTYEYFNPTDNTQDSFILDIGDIGIDPNALTVGDTIGLVVTLRKFPCGEVITETLCMGVVVQSCSSTGPSTSSTLYFPFGIGASNSNYWSGIAIANQSALAGDVTCVLYGEGGGSATYDGGTVDAMGMLRVPVNTAFFNGLTQGTTALSAGDSFQMYCTCGFASDGVMMIGTDDLTALHGYLGRQP
jgi:hypothetical protein